MFPVAEPPRSDKTGRWPKYAGLALLALGILFAGLYAYIFVHIVPPISAKVIDAVTAKPITGINVCLQVDTEGLGHPKVVRSEMARTDDSGRFFFWPTVHDMHLLQDWQGFSIRLTDPRNDFAVPCGADLGPGLSEVHPGQVVNRSTGTKSYFPVVLVEYTDATLNNLWSATRRPMGFPLKMQISLIPMLRKLDDCYQIQDSSLAENCRQLNTEATAYRIERQDPMKENE
jgi:hypothetical protein